MSGNTQPTTDANATATQTTNTTPAIPDSVQQRFNELTAQLHQVRDNAGQAQAMNEALIAQNAKLTEQLMALQNQAQGGGNVLPPLPEGVDPALIDSLSARIAGPLQKQIAQMQNQFQATLGNVMGSQEQMQIANAIAGEADAVKKKVLELHQEVKRSGYTGWTPQNLVWMARGMVGTAPVRSDPSNVALPTAGAPVPQTQTQAPRKSDQELAAMTPDQRLAYYESLPGITGDIQY